MSVFKSLKASLNLLRRRLAIKRFDYEAREAWDFDFRAVRRMVVVKPDGKLGDTQIVISFLKTLKEFCPSLEIAVICPESIGALYGRFALIRELYPLSAHPRSAQIKKICAEVLKKGPADLLLSTEDACKPRDIFLYNQLHPTWLAGLDPQLSCVNLKLYPTCAGQHISVYLIYLMALGGLACPGFAYAPLFGPEEVKKASELTGEGPLVGLAPCGSARARKLTPETCLALVKTISAAGCKTVALLGPGQEAWVEAIKASPLQDRVVLLPRLDFSALAAVIAGLDALVSVDSAPVHLAGAANVPVLGIYSGPGNEIERWYPRPEDNPASEILRLPGKTIAALSAEDICPALATFLGENITLKREPDANRRPRRRRRRR